MSKGVIDYTKNDFEQITYNGTSLIEHIKTKYVNISKAFRDNNKQWNKYKTTKQWKEIEKVAENKIKSGQWKVAENSPPPLNSIYFDINTGPNEFRGIYIHPKLVHFVCQYVSVEYAFKVSELMDSINERVHEQLKQQNKEDTVENAKPIFEQTVSTLSSVVSDKENQQCWGCREKDKFDYLDSWNKSFIRSKFTEFKEALTKYVDITFEELKRDYPQLIE